MVDLLVWQGHSGWLTGVSISHDGGQAVTTSGDGLALVWDLATGEQLRALEGHSAEVTASLMTRKSRCALAQPLLHPGPCIICIPNACMPTGAETSHDLAKQIILSALARGS